MCIKCTAPVKPTPSVLFHMFEQINNRKLTCGPNSHKNTLKAALYKQQYKIKTPYGFQVKVSCQVIRKQPFPVKLFL